MKHRKEPGARSSLILPFHGGTIFCLELDGLGKDRALVLEKFRNDLTELKKPSAPSRIALHLKDTRVDREMAEGILRGLAQPGQHPARLAVVGLTLWERHLWRRLARGMEPPLPFPWAFFSDYEQAKSWLVPPGMSR